MQFPDMQFDQYETFLHMHKGFQVVLLPGQILRGTTPHWMGMKTQNRLEQIQILDNIYIVIMRLHEVLLNQFSEG